MVGNSIISGSRENLLKTNKYKVKVRSVRGVAVQDMTDSIKPILKREPSLITLHARPNNAVSMASWYLLNELIQLKSFIAESNKNGK